MVRLADQQTAAVRIYTLGATPPPAPKLILRGRGILVSNRSGKQPKKPNGGGCGWTAIAVGAAVEFQGINLRVSDRYPAAKKKPSSILGVFNDDPYAQLTAFSKV